MHPFDANHRFYVSQLTHIGDWYHSVCIIMGWDVRGDSLGCLIEKDNWVGLDP